MARPKVKLKSYHDNVYLHPLTSAPTKYQFMHFMVSDI